MVEFRRQWPNHPVMTWYAISNKGIKVDATDANAIEIVIIMGDADVAHVHSDLEINPSLDHPPRGR